jgi:hypothetical protein
MLLYPGLPRDLCAFCWHLVCTWGATLDSTQLLMGSSAIAASDEMKTWGLLGLFDAPAVKSSSTLSNERWGGGG